MDWVWTGPGCAQDWLYTAKNWRTAGLFLNWFAMIFQLVSSLSGFIQFCLKLCPDLHNQTQLNVTLKAIH